MAYPDGCYSFSNPQFRPAERVISAITQAEKAQVTTTVDHLYQDGLKVKIDIPQMRGLPFYGMPQIDGLIGTVEVVDATNFTVTIDSRGFDPFAIPGVLPDAYNCPQVIPIAEENNTLTSAVQNSSGNRNNVI